MISQHFSFQPRHLVTMVMSGLCCHGNAALWPPLPQVIIQPLEDLITGIRHLSVSLRIIRILVGLKIDNRELSEISKPRQVNGEKMFHFNNGLIF